MSRDETPAEKWEREHAQKRKDDPLFAACEDHVNAGQCPPWPFRAERECTRFVQGTTQWLINPQPYVCMQCWRRAMNCSDLRSKIDAGKHAKKDERFRY
jgi:hypothetical protein